MTSVGAVAKDSLRERFYEKRFLEERKDGAKRLTPIMSAMLDEIMVDRELVPEERLLTRANPWIVVVVSATAFGRILDVLELKLGDLWIRSRFKNPDEAKRVGWIGPVENMIEPLEDGTWTEKPLAWRLSEAQDLYTSFGDLDVVAAPAY